MKSFAQQTALVTGASSGIGAAFARALASRGAHLILVARSRDKLEALATELSAKHGVRAQAIAADLARPGAGAELAREVERRGLTVDVLINNAGFTTHGHFETIPAEREEEEIQVNVAALVNLCHAFYPGMVQRHRGAIVNVASLAAFAPLPYQAVYGATKAFVLSFSEALWYEGRSRGVSVLALCPGPTETDFFEAGNIQGLYTTGRQSPEAVVEAGLKALARGRSSVLSGFRNLAMAESIRFAPRTLAIRIAASMARPRPGVGELAAEKARSP